MLVNVILFVEDEIFILIYATNKFANYSSMLSKCPLTDTIHLIDTCNIMFYVTISSMPSHIIGGNYLL